MPSTVLTTWASLSLSTVHTLRVRALGTAIDVWVDGTNVASVTTPHPGTLETHWTYAMFGQDHNTPTSGGVLGTVETGTYFDDVSISSPGASSPYTACDTVTDNFNRADAGDGTLGVAGTGQQWGTMPLPTLAFIESGNNFAAGGTWTTQGGTPNTAQGTFPATNDYYIPFAMLNVHGSNQDITVTGRCDAPDALRIRFRATDFRYGYEAVFNPYSASQLFLFTPGSRGWVVGAITMN